jgi:hypothetical protein
MKRQALKYTVLMYAIVILCVACVASLAHGQLDVKAQYELGEPIIVKMTVEGKPEGAVLRKDKFKIVRVQKEALTGTRVELDSDVTPVKVDGTTWHVWAKPGNYQINAEGEWRLYQTIISKDDKEYKVIADEDDYEFTANFAVGGGDIPVPPPPPPPPPGARWGLILRETKGGQSPALGNLLIQVREAFQDNRMLIHDPTSLPPTLQALVPEVPPLPALMVFARQADGAHKLVRVVQLTDTTTVEVVKQEMAK